MRINAFIKRICQQMIRDKRTLALMMVAPLIILTLIHFLFTSDSDVNFRIGVVNADESLVKQIKNNDITIVKYEQIKAGNQKILDDDLDGLIQLDGDKITLKLTNSSPSETKALQMKLQQIIATEASKKQAANMNDVQHSKQSVPAALTTSKIHTTYVYGDKSTTFFDVLSPILVGFFVFFFVFLISGIALLRERTTGTLDRLMATPILRRDLVFGYLLGYGLFAVIQTVIVVFYAVKVLDILLVGSIWNVLLINLMLALVALSLGILLSAFANTEFQMMQFIPIVVIPQVFFAGIFPVEGMANWLQVIAKFMPMYYGGDALQSIMYQGLGFSDISLDLLVLLGFALLFIILNVLALKKYRKI